MVSPSRFQQLAPEEIQALAVLATSFTASPVGTSEAAQSARTSEAAQSFFQTTGTTTGPTQQRQPGAAAPRQPPLQQRSIKLPTAQTLLLSMELTQPQQTSPEGAAVARRKRSDMKETPPPKRMRTSDQLDDDQHSAPQPHLQQSQTGKYQNVRKDTTLFFPKTSGESTLLKAPRPAYYVVTAF